MIEARLRKIGDDFVVVIPHEEVERRGWMEGQMLTVDSTASALRSGLRPELRQLLDEDWEDLEPGLRYLADR